MVSRRRIVRTKLLKHLPKDSVGAEIGVWRGGFSAQILEVVRPKKLYLIDPWIYQPGYSNAAFGKSKNKDHMPNYYELVSETYKDDERVEVMRMTSEEAWGHFEDHSLDWVYLDGNHNAPIINQDIANALKKVKPKGRIAGDDYFWKTPVGNFPVKNAVTEALEELGDKARFKTIGAQFLMILNR